MVADRIKPRILDGLSSLVKGIFADTLSGNTTMHRHDLDLMLAGSILPPHITHQKKLEVIAHALPSKAESHGFKGDVSAFYDQLKTFADVLKKNADAYDRTVPVQTETLSRLITAKPVLDQYVLHLAQTGAENFLAGADLLEATQLSKALSVIARNNNIPGYQRDSRQIQALYDRAPLRTVPYLDPCEGFEAGGNFMSTVKMIPLHVPAYLDSVSGPANRPH